MLESSKWFSDIDLKDAFFCIPIDEQVQQLFPFEWKVQKLKPSSNTVKLYRHKKFPDHILRNISKRLKEYAIEIGNSSIVCRQLISS